MNGTVGKDVQGDLARGRAVEMARAQLPHVGRLVCAPHDDVVIGTTPPHFLNGRLEEHTHTLTHY